MIGIDRLREEFLQEVRALTGKPCWAFYAGPSTGSSASFDFGEKIPRRIPLINPKLSEDERYYLGEVSLFIECAWRLDSGDRIVCGSTDPNAEDGPMLTGLSMLIGRTVASVKIQGPALDLTLQFTGNIVLRIFSDQTNIAGGYDNYSLLKRDRVYIVGARGRVRCEPRIGEGEVK